MAEKPYTEIKDSDRSETVQAVQGLLNEVVDLISAANKFSQNPEKFGQFNGIREHLAAFGGVAGEARAIDLNWLPNISLLQLRDLSERVKQSLEGLKTFFAGDQRHASPVIGSILESTNEFHEFVLPFVGYAAGRDRGSLRSAINLLEEARSQATATITMAQQALGQAEAIRDPMLRKLDALQEDAARIVSEIRAKSAQVGVSAHARAFRKAAKSYGYSAIAWMTLTFVFGGLAVWALTSWLHADPVPPKADGAAIAQHVLLRAVVILFGVYLTVWTARNYRAQRHLNVVNEHRALALDTFQTFVEATASNAVRDKILVATTRAIFDPGSTGYVGGDEDSSAEKLVALVKMAAGGRGD